MGWRRKGRTVRGLRDAMLTIENMTRDMIDSKPNTDSICRQLPLAGTGSTKRKRGRKPRVDRIPEYRHDNAECAGIILGESERYGGEEGLMVRWARMVA